MLSSDAWPMVFQKPRHAAPSAFYLDHQVPVYDSAAVLTIQTNINLTDGFVA